MGVYDIFYLEIECPKCGNKFNDYAQTKSLYCQMKEYKIGDPIEWPNDEIFVYSYCGKCKETLYQGIRIEGGYVRGKTEAFIKGELPGELDRWFGELYFPSTVAEYLQVYRYEQHIIEKELEEEKSGTINGQTKNN